MRLEVLLNFWALGKVKKNSGWRNMMIKDLEARSAVVCFWNSKLPDVHGEASAQGKPPTSDGELQHDAVGDAAKQGKNHGDGLVLCGTCPSTH